MAESRPRNHTRRRVADSSPPDDDSAESSATSRASRVRLRSFNKSLPMALLRAREAVMRKFRPSLREHGITEQQWRVLRALTAVKDIEILALAETTFLLPPSLSRILRDLEERKLIVRRSSRDDLRRGFISISPKGLALIERVGVQSEAVYSEITRRFGSKRMHALHDLLEQLEQEMSAFGGADDGKTEDE